jgi:hypothetical protein
MSQCANDYKEYIQLFERHYTSEEDLTSFWFLIVGRLEIIWSSGFDSWNSLLLAKIVLQYLPVVEGNLFWQGISRKNANF